MQKKVKILKILKDKGLVDDEKIKEIDELISGGEEFDNIIVNKKLLQTEELAKLKAEIFHMPYVSLLEEQVDPLILNVISSDVAKNYKIVCFSRSSGIIKIGITDPDNFKAIEAVDFLAKGGGLHVDFYVISIDSFNNVFKQYKILDNELSSALQRREEDEALILEEKEEAEVKAKNVSKSAPVTKIVTVIIRQAVEGGASDIHIEPLQRETRVRYRVDGILRTSLVLPRSVHNAIVARIKVMAGLKLDETRIPQDGRIRITINDKDVDFRVSILPLIKTEKVVMRILNTDKGAPKLEDLGFQGIQYDVVINNLKKTEGMMLVTGPTGSGKSTTLFSVLGIINKDKINISTLEDPVEYQMKGVNQSQIKPEIGYTFAAGLRSFLRQDPDVIMVGEIRDEETAELAIHAALTGHSVLSTLHTTSAIGSIPRFVDMGVEPFLISSTLNTIIAQRLARRICPKCKDQLMNVNGYWRCKNCDGFCTGCGALTDEEDIVCPGY